MSESFTTAKVRALDEDVQTEYVEIADELVRSFEHFSGRRHGNRAYQTLISLMVAMAAEVTSDASEEDEQEKEPPVFQ